MTSPVVVVGLGVLRLVLGVIVVVVVGGGGGGWRAGIRRRMARLAVHVEGCRQ